MHKIIEITDANRTLAYEWYLLDEAIETLHALAPPCDYATNDFYNASGERISRRMNAIQAKLDIKYYTQMAQLAEDVYIDGPHPNSGIY